MGILLACSCAEEPPKPTHYTGAEIFFQEQEYAKSKVELQKAFNPKNNQLDFQIFMAKIYARESKFDSSMYFLDMVEKHINRSSTPSIKYQYHLWRGFNLELNKMYDKSYTHYKEAFAVIGEIDDPFYVNFLHMQRISLLSENNYRGEAEGWIESYKKFLLKEKNKTFDSNFHYVLTHFYHFKDTLNEKRTGKSVHHSNEYLKSAVASKHDRTIAHAHFYKGLVFAEQLNNQENAREHFRKSLSLYTDLNIELHKATSIFNIGRTYVRDSNTSVAKNWLYKAWAIKTQARDNHRRKEISKNLKIAYEIEKQWDSAFRYSELFNKYSRIENNEQEAQQLRAKQRETFIDGQDRRNEKNKTITYGLSGATGLIALIAFLLFKNTKKKQRIAEQEKELEIQKTEKLLKEQELTTIDAMIEGQEKERQRLASDLHDSVGATLSAARLQFDHITKNKDQLGKLDELIDKTGSLLEDAYNEVRSMAHLKNSGVIAKNGLLPAVEKLAKNASGTNQLKVEVQDFGLEDRLENSLEITIFRIIQELVTNVIKHANASEATISITQHKDSLNIIVEDNGRGFDAQKFQQNEGMGLGGIEKRIEHLEGTLEVDSSPGNGTSVLIDIPL